ncbi:MAG: FtsX-like permease family protein, partial [Bacteroidota bacterium]
VLMADSNFFEFFTVPLKYGDPSSALNRPGTIAVDATTARKIFGEVDPVGEILVLDNQDDYEVTAVYEDLPENSHFRHNVLLSMSSFGWVEQGHWLSANFNTYLKLEEGVKPEQLEAKFPAMIEKYCGPLIQQFLSMNMEEFAESGNALSFSLMPLMDIHLHSHKEDELGANGDIKYIYIFSIVAGFILLLACINFMNLATARSASRAKEVGVRKAMGALRLQLVSQFLAEALIISCISFVLAYAMAFLLLPAFNDLASKELDYGALLGSRFMIPMVLVLLLAALLAGSYPAFYLSAFRPVQVLKGKARSGMKSGWIRSTLVVFQFGISIVMIIGTGIVADQLSYIQNKNVGFNKDQVLMVQDTWLLRDKAESFRNEASRHSSISTSALTNFSPVGNYNNTDLYFKNADVSSDESLVINEAAVGYDFFETLEMEFLEGRGFDKDMASDSSAVVINETAMRQFGYENAVNDKIYALEGSPEEPAVTGYRIIGVVKDFHFQSMKHEIKPILFQLRSWANGAGLFKVKTKNLDETLNALEATWETFAPGQPFTYKFLDDQFEALYESEQRIGQIFQVFAFLSVFIACLGLFGLASFTAEQRTKEIGIRKVLGASIPSIIGLLSRDFLKLIVIAIVLAAPIAYYFMNQWLTDFEYRTALKPATFILAGILAFAVAWVAMGTQSYRAARANPAQSLKDE